MVLLDMAQPEMQISSHVTPPHIRMRRARHTAPESATCTTARQRDRASSAAAHMLGCLHPPVQAASTRAHNMFVSAKLMLSHHAKGAALVPIFERKLPSSRRRKMSSRLAAAASSASERAGHKVALLLILVNTVRTACDAGASTPAGRASGCRRHRCR